MSQMKQYKITNLGLVVRLVSVFTSKWPII